MDLRADYKKEKGKWASVVCSDAEGNTYFTDDYVEWLEEKLVKNCSIPVVVNHVCPDPMHHAMEIGLADKCPTCGAE